MKGQWAGSKGCCVSTCSQDKTRWVKTKHIAQKNRLQDTQSHQTQGDLEEVGGLSHSNRRVKNKRVSLGMFNTNLTKHQLMNSHLSGWRTGVNTALDQSQAALLACQPMRVRGLWCNIIMLDYIKHYLDFFVQYCCTKQVTCDPSVFGLVDVFLLSFPAGSSLSSTFVSTKFRMRPQTEQTDCPSGRWSQCYFYRQTPE